MIGFLPGGNHPANVGELAIGDVRQDLRRLQNNVIVPIRAEAQMLNGIRRGPDGTCRWGVIPPADSRVVEQVGQGLMIVAGVRFLSFAATRINEPYKFACRSSTPGIAIRIRDPRWILCSEQIAAWAGCGSSRNDELVRRKAGPLVGLEHAIAEGVLFR